MKSWIRNNYFIFHHLCTHIRYNTKEDIRGKLARYSSHTMALYLGTTTGGMEFALEEEVGWNREVSFYLVPASLARLQSTPGGGARQSTGKCVLLFHCMVTAWKSRWSMLIYIFWTQYFLSPAEGVWILKLHARLACIRRHSVPISGPASGTVLHSTMLIQTDVHVSSTEHIIHCWGRINTQDVHSFIY